jgi:hypothetical protein
MTDFRQAPPRSAPFHCSAARHLRKSGLTLAVYDLIGAITNGGDRAFFTSIEKVAAYFDADYETTRRVFKVLVKEGWLELLDVNGMPQYQWISHQTWADRQFENRCFKDIESMPWQEALEPDPLCGHLWAICGGKFRLHRQMLASIRKFATDDVIEAHFKAQWGYACERKARRDFRNVQPKQVFWLVYGKVKEQHKLKEQQSKLRVESPV